MVDASDLCKYRAAESARDSVLSRALVRQCARVSDPVRARKHTDDDRSKCHRSKPVLGQYGCFRQCYQPTHGSLTVMCLEMFFLLVAALSHS